MTKAKGNTLPECKSGRSRKYFKNCPVSENNSYDIDLLQKKYRHILGFKRPIIMLKKYSAPPVINKSSIDLHFKQNETSKKSNSKCVINDTSIIKHEDALSLHNTKLDMAELPGNKTIEIIGGKSKGKARKLNKKPTNDSNSSENKKYASVKSIKNFKSDLWEIKYDAAMKAEALKNGKTLTVCLRRINFDKKPNIVDRNLKTLRKLSEESNIVSTIGFWDWNKCITCNNTELKQTCDTDKNVKTCNNEIGNNTHIDFEKVSCCGKTSLETITSTNRVVSNGTTHMQTSNAVNGAVKKEGLNNDLLEKSNEETGRNTATKIKDFAKNNNHACTKINNAKNCIIKDTVCENNILPNLLNKLHNAKANGQLNATDCNANTAFFLQPVFLENVISSADINTMKCLNKRYKIPVLNTNTLSSNNPLEAKHEKSNIVTEQTTVQPLDKSINLSAQKRINNNQDINRNIKKIKLNRDHWLHSVNCENNKEAGPCNKSNIIKLNADRISKSVITVTESNFVARNKDNENENAQIMEAKIEDAISNLVEQKQIELLNKNTNKRNCDSLQKAWKSQETTLEMQKSPMEDICSVSDKINNNESTTDNENEDFDYVSLYPDADLLKEFDDLITPVQQNSCNSMHSSEKSYEMTESVFSNYYQSTTSEFDKIYDIDNASDHKNNNLVEEKKPLVLRLGPPVCKKTDSLLVKERITYSSQRQETTKRLEKSLTDTFKGFCFQKLRIGTCKKNSCRFNHDFLRRMLLFYASSKKFFFEILDKLVSQNCLEFLTNFHKELLLARADFTCILKVLKKLHEINVATDNIALITIASFEERGKSIEAFLLRVTEIVSKNDAKFVNWILKLIETRIKEYINNGEYWERLRPLIVKVEYLDLPIVENILQECLYTRNNVHDVYENVLMKINDLTSINQKLLSCFRNLLKSTVNKHQVTKEIPSPESVESIRNTSNENQITKEITLPQFVGSTENTLNENQVTKEIALPVFGRSTENTLNENQVTKGIASPESVSRTSNSPVLGNEIDERDEVDVASSTIKTSQTITPKVWVDDTSSKMKNIGNTQNKNNVFILHPIDNLPKPTSAHSRDKFWKFYVNLHSLQEGLKHNDYDYVMKIFNSLKQDQKTVFSRACFRILRNEIKSSQYHLSELASLAVRIGSTAVAYEILLDVMIRILAHLAEKELWVLALKLLRDTHVIIELRKCFSQLDAATILLFIEIYLANRQVIKSFTLLKQTNIIYTDRSKWKSQNDAKDEYVRVRIMTLLLGTLCRLSPEHAFFLFQFLIVNQSSNFYPVDLVRPAHKLLSIFLLKRDKEMILDIARLINNYDITLEPITYRALVSALVNVDIALAKQFYQQAILLGIYFDLKFYPVIYNIVNSDWTKEEMYLMILNIMQQLSSNIGHAADHVKTRQLSVYILFESIPSGKQLDRDEGTNQLCVEKLNKAKKLMARMLQEFNPPISMQTKYKSTLCKLSGKSVHQYLLRTYK